MHRLWRMPLRWTNWLCRQVRFQVCSFPISQRRTNTRMDGGLSLQVEPSSVPTWWSCSWETALSSQTCSRSTERVVWLGYIDLHTVILNRPSQGKSIFSMNTPVWLQEVWRSPSERVDLCWSKLHRVEADRSHMLAIQVSREHHWYLQWQLKGRCSWRHWQVPHLQACSHHWSVPRKSCLPTLWAFVRKSTWRLGRQDWKTSSSSVQC